MYRLALLFLASGVLAGAGFAAAPLEADVQGFYQGACTGEKGEKKFEARVVATGHGAYQVFVRQPLDTQPSGPKPSDNGKVAKFELEGKTEGDVVRFVGKGENGPWTASYSDGTLKGTCGPGTRLEMKRVILRSPTFNAKPPEGAIVLLDGKNFDELTKKRLSNGSEQPWKLVADGGIEVPKGGMTTKRHFDGSYKLHVEFKIPLMPAERSQGRGNSGVFLTNSDEIQVLDSFGMTTYKGGGCGGVYAYKDPDAFDQFSLASYPPLTWQTYDIEYRVEKKDGKPVGFLDDAKPRVTVFHNGIKIHDNFAIRGAVVGYAPKGKFHFQDHGNPVEYRNIWVLPLADP